MKSDRMNHLPLIMADPTKHSPLGFSELDLINEMTLNYEGVKRNLGGDPFAIVCKTGRKRRYERLAEYLRLQLFESDKVFRDDGMVLIHAGELPEWVTLTT